MSGGMIDLLSRGPSAQGPSESMERIAILAAETSRQANFVQLIVAIKDLPKEAREQIIKESGLLPKVVPVVASPAVHSSASAVRIHDIAIATPSKSSIEKIEDSLMTSSAVTEAVPGVDDSVIEALLIEAEASV